MSDAPNFRVRISSEYGDDSVQPLKLFLEENEGVPDFCSKVTALQPGEETKYGIFRVTRIAVSPPRYTRVRVPIDLKEFRGSETATVTLDRKRLTMSIRPLRRRTVVELPLSELAEKYLAKQVKLDVLAKRKARRARR